MSSRRFILVAVGLFMLGALPFLIVQPTAAASAGLSLGFSAPLGHWAVIGLLFIAGLFAAMLPRDGLLLITLSFTLMIMLGGMLILDVSQFTPLRYFVLGAVLCLSLLVGITRQKLTLLTILVLASLGFHLGGFYMQQVPNIASPIYFLLGVLLSLSMILAISVAFGVTLFGDNEAAWEKIKESPRLRVIRSIFL
jgi:hydrogenase/urease accessory protein HupE